MANKNSISPYSFDMKDLAENKITIKTDDVRFLEFEKGTVCQMYVTISIPVKIFNGKFSGKFSKFIYLGLPPVNNREDYTIFVYGSSNSEGNISSDDLTSDRMSAITAMKDAEKSLVNAILSEYKSDKPITIDDICFIKTKKDYL